MHNDRRSVANLNAAPTRPRSIPRSFVTACPVMYERQVLRGLVQRTKERLATVQRKGKRERPGPWAQGPLPETLRLEVGCLRLHRVTSVWPTWHQHSARNTRVNILSFEARNLDPRAPLGPPISATGSRATLLALAIRLSSSPSSPTSTLMMLIWEWEGIRDPKILNKHRRSFARVISKEILREIFQMEVSHSETSGLIKINGSLNTLDSKEGYGETFFFFFCCWHRAPRVSMNVWSGDL